MRYSNGQAEIDHRPTKRRDATLLASTSCELIETKLYANVVILCHIFRQEHIVAATFLRDSDFVTFTSCNKWSK